MRWILALTLFCSSLPAVAKDLTDLGDPVSLKDFIALTVGDYVITKADGNDTKYPDGSVVDEETDLVLTFPYCPVGGTLCDPGYIFLPKEPKTAVAIYKKEIKNQGTLYTIVHKEGTDEFVYEWEVPLTAGDSLTFRRYDYVYGTNPPITLEFLFTKKTPTP